MLRKPLFPALMCLLFAFQAELHAQPENVSTTERTAPQFESGDSSPRTGESASIDLGISKNHLHELFNEGPSSERSSLRAQLQSQPTPSAAAPLIYDANEFEARSKNLKSRISAFFGNETPAEKSEEERELALQRDIARSKSQVGLTGASSNGSARARSDDKAGSTLRLRLLEIAFLIWDLITHPMTVTLLILAFIGRSVLALLRLKREKHGRRRHTHSRRRSDRSDMSRTAEAQSPRPLTDYEERLERRLERRSSKSRRSRRRSSVFKLFRST